MPSKTREEDISVDAAPTTIDPYTILSLSKDATQDQVKAAYRKAALISHPDKAAPEAKDAAHTKFQEVAFAYAILSDERRRKRYDTTGSTEESLIEDEDFDWASFFRDQFSDVVSFDSVDKFAQEYKGSEEERGHVLQAYDQGKGNIDRVYSSVMLSDVLEDDERFRAIIDKAIANGEAETYAKYTNETQKSKDARIRRAKQTREREAPEAEESKKEILEKKAKAVGRRSQPGIQGIWATWQC